MFKKSHLTFLVSVYKLNMQILSQVPFSKKGGYSSTSLHGKKTMSDDFELGAEDEMEPTSSVAFSTSLCEAHVAEQSKRWGNLMLFYCLHHSNFPVFILETAFACKKQILCFNVTLS